MFSDTLSKIHELEPPATNITNDLFKSGLYLFQSFIKNYQYEECLGVLTPLQPYVKYANREVQQMFHIGSILIELLKPTACI